MARVRPLNHDRRRLLTNLGVLQIDPWLEPFKSALKERFSRAQSWIKSINDTEGGLEKFSRGYEKFGFMVKDNGDILYREWAPNATQAYLIGEFSKIPKAPRPHAFNHS